MASKKMKVESKDHDDMAAEGDDEMEFDEEIDEI